MLRAGTMAAAAACFAPRRAVARAEESSTSKSGRAIDGNHNDPHLHLFVDDAEIASVENLNRVVNRPKKHPQPVLVADRPWEGDRAQAWGSVIQEPDGLLRMWYFGFNTERRPGELDRGGYCYAESRDGIRWEKPELDLVEFRGSRKNNLFYTCAPDSKNLVDEELARRGTGLPALDEKGEQIGVLNNLDGLTVVKDDDDPDPQRRYKLVANYQDHRMWASYDKSKYPGVTDEQIKQAYKVHGQYMDTSPDGIHWARKPRRLVPASGDYMMVTRDHRNRRWWLNERAPGRGGRNAALRTSPDWVNWTKPQIIFDNDAETNFAKDFEWHGGMTPFNYGNLNLGLLEKWPNTGFGATCELIVNRDGGPWTRVAPGVPFLDVGPEGSFDRTLIYPSHNAPIRLGDQLLIFYTGGGAKSLKMKGLPMSMGLAAVGLDRFAAMAQWRSDKPGVLVTKPAMIPGGRLELNVEQFERGAVSVAVTTSDGQGIPGFGLEDSQVDYDPSRPRSPVSWRERRDLSGLVAKTCSIRFEIKAGAVYGYRFVKS
jgi:hypothetical protein